MKKLRLVVPALAALASFEARSAEIISWANPAGGDWNIAANWSLNRVPQPEDTAVISLAGAYTVNLSGPISVGSLAVGRGANSPTLANNGHNITIGADSAIAENATLLFSGGTLDGPGNLNVRGAIAWSGGVVAGAARIIVEPTGLMTLTGSDEKKLDSGRVLENSGRIIWTDGRFDLNSGADLGAGRIENLEGATFDVRGEALWLRASGFGDLPYGTTWPSFQNYGTIVRSAGEGEFWLDVPFSNYGALRAETGLTRFKYTAGNRGTMHASLGATIAGHMVFNDSGFNALAGEGTYLVDTGVDQFFASYTVENLRMVSGRLFGPGDITVTGGMHWTGGLMGNSGRTIIQSGVTLTMDGPGEKEINDGRILENHGSIIWIEGNLDLNGWGSGPSGRIENAASGVIDARATARAFVNGYSELEPDPFHILNNVGTFRKTVPGELTFDVPLVNSGVVEIQQGVLIINKRLQLEPTGRLKFPISRSTHGLIRINTEQQFNGALEVELLDGFVPQEGAEFQIIATAVPSSGNFATLLGAALPNGLFLNPIYDVSGVKLVATPIRPNIRFPSNAAGQFRLTGIAGQRYRIQATTTLLDNDWITIDTPTIPENGYLDFSDPRAHEHSFRFYRAFFVQSP